MINKMKKNVLLWAVIALLLVLNLIALYRYRQSQIELQTVSYRINELSVKEARESSVLKKFMLLQQVSEGVSCKEMEIQDAKTKETITMASLFKNNDALLFFRFKENDCDACVSKSVRLLEDMSEHFPANGIVILSGYGNVRQFYAYAQSKERHFRVFNAGALPVDAENQEQPYFFVVTPDLKIQNVFIVSKEDEKMTSSYLHVISHKYWNVCSHGHEH